MGEITKTDDQICEEALQAVISASAKQQVDESMEMVQEVNPRKKPGRKPKIKLVATPVAIPEAVRSQLIEDLSSIDTKLSETEHKLKCLNTVYDTLLNRREAICSFLDSSIDTQQ